MRAVTVTPYGSPRCTIATQEALEQVNPTRGLPRGKGSDSGASGEVLRKALEFERRWTKHRTLLPTELGPWTDKCMCYYADFAVTFTPTGFEVRKRSDYATDEILAAVIQLAAEIHNSNGGQNG